MVDIYKNIEEYNPNKKQKILIVFDDMTAHKLSNKKLNPIVTELFITGKKLNISLAFITQYYFAMPKNFRLDSTHYFIMKVPNKRELQQIAFNHSSDIDFQDFMNFYKNCTAKPYSFLVIDTTLASDNRSRFRKIFQKEYKSQSWQLMIKLKMKDYNTIFTEKQQKYRHYRQVKLISMNILQLKKYYYLIKVE